MRRGVPCPYSRREARSAGGTFATGERACQRVPAGWFARLAVTRGTQPERRTATLPQRADRRESWRALCRHRASFSAGSCRRSQRRQRHDMDPVSGRSCRERNNAPGPLTRLRMTPVTVRSSGGFRGRAGRANRCSRPRVDPATEPGSTCCQRHDGHDRLPRAVETRLRRVGGPYRGRARDRAGTNRTARPRLDARGTGPEASSVTVTELTLYGATGFVGRVTARHLAEHAPAGARIALAGRSLPRLEALQRELGRAPRTGFS